MNSTEFTHSLLSPFKNRLLRKAMQTMISPQNMLIILFGLDITLGNPCSIYDIVVQHGYTSLGAIHSPGKPVVWVFLFRTLTNILHFQMQSMSYKVRVLVIDRISRYVRQIIESWQVPFRSTHWGVSQCKLIDNLCVGNENLFFIFRYFQCLKLPILTSVTHWKSAVLLL